MKYKELLSKNEAELIKIKAETELDLIKENAQIAGGTVPKNPGNVSKMKKTIAKINQIMATKSKEDSN